jgi:dUTP pyrophosphatase
MLKFLRLRPEAIAPVIAHPGEDLGYDLATPDDVFMPPFTVTAIPLGLAIEFAPSAGALIKERSSLARHLTCVGGVIDAGYRNEVIVLAYNLTPNNLRFDAGERIAQLLRWPVPDDSVVEVAALSLSKRHMGGFGSTNIPVTQAVSVGS